MLTWFQNSHKNPNNFLFSHSVLAVIVFIIFWWQISYLVFTCIFSLRTITSINQNSAPAGFWRLQNQNNLSWFLWSLSRAPHYTQVLRLIAWKTGRVKIWLTIGKKKGRIVPLIWLKQQFNQQFLNYEIAINTNLYCA